MYVLLPSGSRAIACQDKTSVKKRPVNSRGGMENARPLTVGFSHHGRAANYGAGDDRRRVNQ